MRYLFVIFALAAYPSTAAVQGSQQDEAQIRAQIQGYVDAFNRGDADALASYVDAKGTRINAAGRVFTGKAEIQNHYRQVFSSALPEGVRRKLSHDDVTVDFITGDVIKLASLPPAHSGRAGVAGALGEPVRHSSLRGRRRAFPGYRLPPMIVHYVREAGILDVIPGRSECDGRS